MAEEQEDGISDKKSEDLATGELPDHFFSTPCVITPEEAEENLKRLADALNSQTNRTEESDFEAL